MDIELPAYKITVKSWIKRLPLTTMITIFEDFCNPISQDNYDKTIQSLPFHQLTCTCGHSSCLTIHGYYDRVNGKYFPAKIGYYFPAVSGK